jgi:glycosyltransferase involved in cell wall biosynthesis
MSGPYKIALAVHGRFHAFDLANGLLQAGHDVTVFTNYPGRVAQQFGLPAERVVSNTMQGVGARVAHRLMASGADAWVNPWFGRWAARKLSEKRWDINHIWSGVAAEWLDHPASNGVNTIARGSAHIRTQRALLDEEEHRTGGRLDKPSDWIIDREEHEYARTRLIVVPSRFAYDSFLERGIGRERLRLVPLAAAPPTFIAPPAILEARIARLERREPLRVLFVGSITYQKGMHDLLQVMESVPAHRFHFRLVGQLTAECKSIAGRLFARAELIGKVPQNALPAHYAWADLFVLPSIQDGFAVVLSQAVAAGVPFIASANSGGPDLVTGGLPCWVVPARAPRQLADLVLAIDEDREDLMRRVREVASRAVQRDWADVARHFVQEAAA